MVCRQMQTWCSTYGAPSCPILTLCAVEVPQTSTGRHPKVAKYVRSFPQTKEFLDKTTEMLKFLLPHYVDEGKRLFDRCVWMYRWAASVGLHRRGDEEAAGGGGASREDGAPGHAAMRDADSGVALKRPVELVR